MNISDANLAAAIAAYNAMTLEQQQKLHDMQRRSWGIGELMLEHPDMTREQAEDIYDRVVF